MILPGLLELLFGGQGQPILLLHRFCSSLTTVAALLVALLGLLAVLKTRRSHQPEASGLQPARMMSRLGAMPSAGLWTDAILPIDDVALRVLAFVPTLYIISAPYLGLQYDTGLYHLPSVLHFQAFGPEVGLANFHFSFGFFNLQQFPQVSLQNLSRSRFVLSPSLNLIFLEVFILTVVSSLARQNRQTRPASSQLTTRVLMFLATGLIFGMESLNSLVSFDADFAVFMTTLTLIFSLYFPHPAQQHDQALALSLFLPLLKLSGLLGLVMILLHELLLKQTSAQAIRLSSIVKDMRLWAEAIRRRKNLVGAILLAYLGMMATNLITSGYLLFPIPITGPLGSHAVPKASTHYIRSALVTNYARFNDNGLASTRIYPKHLSHSDWLPDFLSTSRGQLMAIWVIFALALFLVIAGIVIVGQQRRDQERRLLCFSFCLVVVVMLALFVLPPNPRFFPWIGSLLGFEIAELFIFYPIITVAAAILTMTLMGLRLQRSLLKATGPEPYTIRSLSRDQLHGWRSRAEPIDAQSRIPVRSPQRDKCWSIQPPCTPYIPSAEGKSKRSSID